MTAWDDEPSGSGGLPWRLGATGSRISRAHILVSELRKTITEWTDTQPYRLTRLEGHTPGTVVDRADGAGSPPWEAALIVSDAIHEARAALDNLVNALRPDGPAAAIRFPLAADPLVYDREAKDALRGLPEWALRSIGAMQPFHDDGRSIGAELQRLHELARYDRHRLLPLHAAVLQPDFVEGEVEEFRGDGRTWAETEYWPERVQRVHFSLEVRFGPEIRAVANFEVVSATLFLVNLAGSVVQGMTDQWRLNTW